MIRHLVWIGLMAGAVGCGGGASRWVPNPGARALNIGDPVAAHQLAVYTLRTQGYHIVQDDPAQLFVRAQFRQCGSIVKNISYFNLQARPDGQLELDVSGYHVRGKGEDGVLDRVFAPAVEHLLQALQQNATLPRPLPPPPAEPPGELPCNA